MATKKLSKLQFTTLENTSDTIKVINKQIKKHQKKKQSKLTRQLETHKIVCEEHKEIYEDKHVHTELCTDACESKTGNKLEEKSEDKIKYIQAMIRTISYRIAHLTNIKLMTQYMNITTTEKEIPSKEDFMNSNIDKIILEFITLFSKYDYLKEIKITPDTMLIITKVLYIKFFKNEFLSQK